MTIPAPIQALLNFLKNPLYSGIVKTVVNTIFNAGLEIEPGGRVKAKIGGYILTVTKNEGIITLEIQKENPDNQG